MHVHQVKAGSQIPNQGDPQLCLHWTTATEPQRKLAVISSLQIQCINAQDAGADAKPAHRQSKSVTTACGQAPYYRAQSTHASEQVSSSAKTNQWAPDAGAV